MISFYGYEVCWYDVISSRWSSHFEGKCMFFPTFSTIKVNLVDEIMQSAYLYVIIHVKPLPFLPVSTWFLILGKIQDGHHCWWRHRPPAVPQLTILVKKIKGFSVKAKSLRNTATYQKLWGGAVADPGEGPGGAGPPYFSTKMRPQGPKKLFSVRMYILEGFLLKCVFTSMI